MSRYFLSHYLFMGRSVSFVNEHEKCSLFSILCQIFKVFVFQFQFPTENHINIDYAILEQMGQRHLSVVFVVWSPFWKPIRFKLNDIYWMTHECFNFFNFKEDW